MSDQPAYKPQPWPETVMVEIVRKQCPYCQWTKFENVWSESNGDDRSRTQFQVCKRCSRRIRFVVNPPSGDSVIFPV